MLKLNTNSPNTNTLQHLAKQQGIINKLSIDKRKAKAKTLWDSKLSGKGEAAFIHVKEILISMCVSTELCNYCEHNEATDIEHIYPKSFFPERAFQWSNYLLACGTCNTHYKIDQFSVFVPIASVIVVILQRMQLAPSDDAAFIDPRVENPMDYLFLDIKEDSFQLFPHPDLTGSREISKAERTLAVLQIDRRPALANARKAACKFYQNQLDRYRKVRDATIWDELEELVQDPHWLNKTNTFEAEQQDMLSNIKASILEHLHPTVWYEMKRQRQSLPKIKRLFEAVSEALDW